MVFIVKRVLSLSMVLMKPKLQKPRVSKSQRLVIVSIKIIICWMKMATIY